MDTVSGIDMADDAYKKRFHRNKEREELHRLLQKFIRGELDSDDEESSLSKDPTAWLPSASVELDEKKSTKTTQSEDLPELVENVSEFDEKVEEFETKYNFRFHAGKQAAQIGSYGRDVVNAQAVRHDK
ncbi:hypothetical protein V1525DRAFT_73048 [Lipomyces kononenkoae]|uniref:Uncharacterized protein n=1 Tax=Lipomyces kononenkoae TaxID=34357 RepID=A0ACC3SRK6_LIPKO